LQAAAVLTVWIHACIGVHFWLRTKARYAGWRPLFVGLGILLPTLALSGYVTAGNQVLRAAESPNYAKLSLEASNLTDQKRAEIGRIAVWARPFTWLCYCCRLPAGVCAAGSIAIADGLC